MRQPRSRGPGGRQGDRLVALGLVLTSMTSVQLGVALSLGLVARLGVAGTSWLRLTWAAVASVAVVRPRLRQLGRADLLATTALGVTSAVMSLTFVAAATRLPLGTVVAVEFLGPLGVAAVRGHSPRRVAVPAGLATGNPRLGSTRTLVMAGEVRATAR